MTIRLATIADLAVLAENDRHITHANLLDAISHNRIYIAEADGELVGWLRYGLFWDSIPFMNMLYLLDGYRGKGYGRQLVEHWERAMAEVGHKRVMTSTQSDEFAQHFYQHMGYCVIGGFLMGDDPYEVILVKDIG